MKQFFLFLLICISRNCNLVEATLEWMKPDGTTEINAIESGRGNIIYNGTENGENLTDWGWIVFLNENPGYGIEITVDKLSVDASLGEYLILAAGTTADENSTMIKILTSNPKSPIYFRLPATKSFFVKFFSYQGFFNLTYDRYGAPATTSRPPSEDPKPPDHENTRYEIYLKGRRVQDYVDDEEFISKFKDIVKVIAKNYCFQKNLTFHEKPTNKTVFLYQITRCPFEWPDDYLCASVAHSVYVSETEIDNTRLIVDYQLNSTHLKDMWDNYEKNENELALLGISIYVLPDTSSTILWWVLIVIICLAVILASLILFWKFEHLFFRERKRESVPENPDAAVKLRNQYRGARLSEYQNIPTFMTDPEAVLEYSKGSRRDKNSRKPPALPNIEIIDTPLSSETVSPLSPVTPAGNFTAGPRFNYRNNAFEGEEITNSPQKIN